MADNLAFADADYRNSYVAFLDILGFSDLTQKTDVRPEWRSYLRASIEALNQTLPGQIEHSGFRFVQFSDSIVLSAARTPEGLLSIIQGCLMLVNNMLGRNILLRGGIAAGNFHHDDKMMFGPALIRAYAHDKAGAPPHIALDPDVMRDMEPNLLHGSFQQFVTTDPWDLSPMLDTLYELAVYDGVPHPGQVVWDGLAVDRAQQIHVLAHDMTALPAVRAKWRWMQDYWNETVGKRGLLVRSELRDDWEAVAARVEDELRARMARFNEALPGAAA